MVMTSAAVWMGNEKQAEAAASFKVHFIEVGTGDGALLQYGSGKSAKYALIDAGPQTTQLLGGKTIDVSRRVHNYLKKYKIRRLEFIIMTHPHKDHIGGFISILEDRSISVGKVYATQQPVYNHYSGDDDFYSTKTYRTVNELIAERNQKGMLLHDYTIVEATFPFYSDYITISVSFRIYHGLSEYMFHFLGEILVAVTGEI